MSDIKTLTVTIFVGEGHKINETVLRALPSTESKPHQHLQGNEVTLQECCHLE